MADGEQGGNSKDGQIGEVLVMPPLPHPPVPADIVAPASPPSGIIIGVKTSLPQEHKQPPAPYVETTGGAVGQMVLMGLADGGKGKNKYAPKKCEHGR